MFKRHQRCALLCTVVLALFSACRKEETPVFRLIDHLTPDGVLETPLARLRDHFPILTQTAAGVDLPTAKIEGREYVLLPSRAPLLAQAGADRPERLTVRRDGQIIPPLEARSSDAAGWVWLKGEALTRADIYLKPGERFDTSVFLPPGPAVIEISGYPTGDAPRALRVEVNGRVAGEVAIGSEGSVRLSAEAVLGENSLGVVFSGADASAAKPGLVASKAVRISAILVRSMSDLVLIARPSAERTFQGSYAVEYATLPEDVVQWMASSLQVAPVFGRDGWLLLYALEHYALADAGSGDNPFAVKKKLKAENNVTFNALMAPAPSRLAVPCRIPGGAILKFGTGFAERISENAADAVTFRIVLESGERHDVLFERVVHPGLAERKASVSWQSVALDAWSGRKGRLVLETEGEAAYPAPAFWANPQIVPGKAEPSPSKDRVPPNVILISIDTLRADHLRCYGYARETSPAMDALASDSALFENARSHAPYTLSSHASILTGLLPTSHQVLQLDQSLDASALTLADRFRSRGYLTAAIVGGGQVSARYGMAKGFDLFDERAWIHQENDLAGLHYGRVANWLKDNRSVPFFLFIHTYQPHDPYDAPAPWGRMFLAPDAPWPSA
ncbi:MAG: sulfatase-like hydrolase/transferase, partial [Candidatus Aminicenantes bacterium]|nr:sulfatase-like hydrolase/transferase [Candidatus Aminicenantes bacterium]